jgi:hypothetical protein
VIQAVLGDLPPPDEHASQQIAEARLLYREWQAYWNRHEYWAQSLVPSGWVNTVGLDVERGRTTRINRLSLNGVTNVTNDDTWLDEPVAQLFNMTNLSLAFIPGDGLPEGQVQEVTRYLVVGNTADYWPVQNNHNGEARGEAEEEVDGMEMVEEEVNQAEAAKVAGQPRGAGPSQNQIQSQMIQSSRPM